MGAAESTATDEAESSELVERRNRNIKRMDQAVRKRLRGGRGFSYNMKLIIRGERGTGKTALWRRLQGMSLTDIYSPTPEIQTANINWSFKNLDEAVKVEVWDVVDGNDEVAEKEQALGLNSSVVNVYQNTNAVIFMVNRNAVESFEYVKARMLDVPQDASVLVLINFRDQPAKSPSAQPPETDATNEGALPPSAEGADVEQKDSTMKAEEPPTATQEPSPDASAEDANEQNPSTEEPAVLSSLTPETPSFSEETANITSDDNAPISDSTDEALAPNQEQSQASTATLEEDSPGAAPESKSEVAARVPWETMSPEEVAMELGGSRTVLCFECSMSNCFGLKLLYTYLNIPFLALKKANMLQALKVLESEALAAGDDMAQLVSATSYEGYVEHLSKTKAPARVPKPRASMNSDVVGATRSTATGERDGKADDDAHAAQRASVAQETASSTPENKDANKPSEEISEPSGHEMKPNAPPAVTGVDDEMSVLNQHALKSNAVSTFFDDDDDDDLSPLPTANVPTPPAATSGEESTIPGKSVRDPVDEDSDDDAIPSAMASTHQNVNGDDDSSDDEFYSQPKFGSSAVAAPPLPPPVADPTPPSPSVADAAAIPPLPAVAKPSPAADPSPSLSVAEPAPSVADPAPSSVAEPAPSVAEPAPSSVADDAPVAEADDAPMAEAAPSDDGPTSNDASRDAPDSPPPSPPDPNQRPETTGASQTLPNGASSNPHEGSDTKTAEASEVTSEGAKVEKVLPSTAEADIAEDGDIASWVEPSGSDNAWLEEESDDKNLHGDNEEKAGSAETPVLATEGGEAVEHSGKDIPREEEEDLSEEPAVGSSSGSTPLETNESVDDAASPADAVDSSPATVVPSLDDPSSLPSATESFLSEEPKSAQPEKVSRFEIIKPYLLFFTL